MTTMSPANLEFSATQLSPTSRGGTLVFSPGGIDFYPLLSRHETIHIPASAITNFAVDTVDTRRDEMTFPRLFFLDVLAFAFPKTTGSLSIIITVQTADRQTSFQIDEDTIENIRPKVYHYLDAWRIIPKD